MSTRVPDIGRGRAGGGAVEEAFEDKRAGASAPLRRAARGAGFRPLAGALLAVALLLLAPVVAPAQFGQNKVQYRQMDWAVLKTDHFEVYFREGLRQFAVDAGRMAERAYERLSTILDHDVRDPIPLVIYGSQTEFQQTNLTSGFIGEGTGGFTEFAKRRVALPMTGSYADFDHVLTHELVHAFQLDILSGGGERSLLSPGAYTPPLWFTEGMSEYLSLGRVDPLTEMWLRDGALQGYLTSVEALERVYDIRIYRYGQAMVAYLGATYGDEVIGRIVKRLPHYRSLGRALEEVVGLTLKKFSEDWTEAMRKQYLPQIRDHQKPDDFAFRLTDASDDLSDLNVTPAVSPDGLFLAYFSDRSLYNDLYVASALTGQIQRRLVKNERQADFESLRFFRSALDWSPDGRNVIFVAQSGGRDILTIQRAEDGRILRRIRPELDGIVSPSFSPDGEWIAFAGQLGGRTDLYRCRADGSQLERLTDNRFLAQEPRWSPDGRRLVFVTDLGVESELEHLRFSPTRLALFDLASREVTVLPAQAGGNISPHFFPDGRHLLFLSDRSGISNLWIRDLQTNEDRRITDVLSGIGGVTETSPAASLSRQGNRVVFSAFSRGTWDLFALKDPLSLWEKGVRWDGPYPEPAAGFVLGSAGETSARDSSGAAGEASSSGAAGEAPSSGATADPLSSGAAREARSPGRAVETSSTVAAGETSPSAGAVETSSPGAAVGTSSSAAADTLGGGAVPVEIDTTGFAAAPHRPRVGATDARLDTLLSRVEPLGNGDRAVPPEFRRERGPGAPPDGAPAGGGPGREPRKGGALDDSTETPVSVAEVLRRERNLPDSTGFTVEPYRPRFTADYVAANGFFAGNVGVAAQSLLQFSDMLGDHVFVIGANVYGSISDSDFLFQYVNLKRRLNWGVSAYQFRNDYYIYAAEDSDEFVSQMYRGASLVLQRPFNRFRRLEWSLDALAVSEEVFRESFSSSGGVETDSRGKETLLFVAPGAALVTDNALWGPTGPVGGGRSRYSFEVGIGDVSYQTYLADVRRYVNIRHQFALAGRVIGASSLGDDPQFFRIGGPYTLRGWSYGGLRGTRIGLMNLELRFPLIDYLQIGFPLPIAIGGVRGAVFFDAGAAWEDTSNFRAFRTVDGTWRMEDIKGAFGLSTSMNVGFTVVRWYLAWRTDLAHTPGAARGYFSLGLDF